MKRKPWALIRRYLPLLRPYTSSIILITFLGIAQMGASLLTPWMTKIIIDQVLLSQPGSPAWTLGSAIAVLGAAFALGIGLQFLRSYVTAGLWGRTVQDLRRRLFAHLQTLSPAYYDTRQAGAVASRITADVEGAQQLISGGGLQLFVDALIVLFAGIMVLYLHWKLALLCLCILPLYYVTFRRFNPTIRRAWREVHQRMETLTGFTVERLSGLRTVQAFGQQASEQARFERQSGDHTREAHRAFLFSNLFGRMNQAYSDAGKLMIWFAGAYFVQQGDLTLGSLIAFQAYLVQLYAPIYRFSELNVMLQNALAHVERIFEVLDTKPQIASRRDALPLARCRGELQFERVSFRYGTGTSASPDAEPAVLEEIDFHARPGEIVALVGRSGAGKSTLIQLIPRFYDPVCGRVLIDGVDIRSYDVADLRQQLALVLQDNTLFSGTIRENITYGRPDATPEEVHAAAEAARVDEFVREWEAGYDTLVGERGLRLSGGQQQRIAIARALLRNPGILILDEATSALDAESESAVTAALERLMEGRTTVIIAHRLATVVRADLILVLDHGRIVERGTHAELLQRSGIYRELYEKQLQAMQPEAYSPLPV